MKSVIIIFLVFFSSCLSPKADIAVIKDDNNYVIKTIDGCEYIEFDYGILSQRVYSLTHKGNCKNPIHVCK